MVLLVSAGLLTRSLMAAQRIGIGFRDRRDRGRLDRDEHDRLRRCAGEGSFTIACWNVCARMPDVESVGARRAAAVFDQLQPQQRVPAGSPRPERQGTGPRRHARLVRSISRRSASRFCRAAISRRRTRRTTPRVAIVNEAMARKYWPNQTARSANASGCDRSTAPRSRSSASPPITKSAPSAKPPRRTCTTPCRSSPSTGEVIVARGRGDAGALLSSDAPRDRGARAERRLSRQPDDGRRRWRRRCCRRELGAMGVSAVGVVAMALAAIGLYGVIAYAVARRTREIGIRMALGARPSAVVALVLRQGLGIAAVGVGVGAVMALGAAKAIGGALYGVSVVDPIAWSGAVVDAVRRRGAGESRAGAPRVGGRSVRRAARRVSAHRRASHQPER